MRHGVFYNTLSCAVSRHSGSCCQGLLRDCTYEVGRRNRLGSNDGGKPLNNDFVEIEPKLRGISPATDIAIFDLPDFLHMEELPLVADQGGLTLGQRVYWLGYPLSYDGGIEFNDGGWVGLAASGTLASFQVPSVLSGRRSMSPVAVEGCIVDGLSYEGYSGSPVVFYPGEDRSKRIRTLGVISETLAAETNWGLIVVGSLTGAIREILE